MVAAGHSAASHRLVGFHPFPQQNWFDEVSVKTGELVAKWQMAGFCHGVLNTDK